MSLREQYDNDLLRLETALDGMGDTVCAALEASLSALHEQDKAALQAIIDGDDVIDTREREIEHLCMTLLLRQQPVASDLRKVSGTLKIVTDLERMGDHAADMAEVGLDMSRKIELPEVCLKMAEQSVSMLREAMTAFLAVDEEKAQKVIAADDTQDELFIQLKKVLAQQMTENPEQADSVLDLLMIGKYLERVADHAVNVAEWTKFCKNGVYRSEQIV